MTYFVDLENHYIQQLRDVIQGWNLSDEEHISVGSYGDKLNRLPRVHVEATGMTSGGLQWTDKFEFGMHFAVFFPMTQYEKYRLHRDPTNEQGLLRAILELEYQGSRMNFEDLDPIGFEDIPAKLKGSVEQVWSMHIEGFRTYGIPRSATYRTPQPDDPRYPPTLPADMHDAWGIAADNANNILYLSQGSSLTEEESKIHTYDLLTNDRRSQEIAAGAAIGQYRRGMEYADGFLYVVADSTTRGTWNLQKIDVSTDTLVATADLGSGEFTGVSAYGDNLEWISVGERVGAGTHYRVYAASDLARHQSEEDDSLATGYSAGMVDLANYWYDIIGSTAIAYNDNGRSPFVDIYLGDFRTQWRGATVRKNYLWVTGVYDDGAGEKDLIGSFRIPDEVFSD